MKTELKIILQKMQKKELIDFIGLVLEKPNIWENIDEYISHYFCEDMFESSPLEEKYDTNGENLKK
jgi:hypothetical protein